MVALVQASTALPIMIFSLVSGALADNFNRRSIMLTAQIFMFVVSLCLTMFAWFGLLTPWLLLSFSDEGFFTREAIVELLAERGETAVAPIDFPRYVGARIGIHDPRGERVGEVSHVRNTEFLFLCGPNANEVLALSSEAATA